MALRTRLATRVPESRRSALVSKLYRHTGTALEPNTQTRRMFTGSAVGVLLHQDARHRGKSDKRLRSAELSEPSRRSSSPSSMRRGGLPQSVAFLPTSPPKKRRCSSSTGLHVTRMAVITAFLGSQLKLDAEFVQLLREAAPMHDVGRIGTSEEILASRVTASTKRSLPLGIDRSAEVVDPLEGLR